MSGYETIVARAILKEPNFYFFDLPRVRDEGVRLENLVACALLKQVNYLEDTQGLNTRLHYLRTKDGKEVDFLLVVDEKPVLCCEVKLSDTTPSKDLKIFQQQLGLKNALQLVLNCQREFDTVDGIQVRELANFLASFSLLDYININ